MATLEMTMSLLAVWKIDCTWVVRGLLHLILCEKFLVEQNSYWSLNIRLFLDCC
jgi:hypothetical protein